MMLSEVDGSEQARVTKAGKTGKERQPFLYGTNEKGLRPITRSQALCGSTAS